MNARKTRFAAVGLVAAGMLALSACASGGTADAVAPTGGGAKTVACQAVKVGEITSCSNFYTDIWPQIDKQMDGLYAKAKATDGGRIVIWDWYELSPDVIAQFTKKYPGLKIETRGLTYNLPSAIISAKATGSRNTDVISGSIVSAAAMTDQGFWDKVDWTKYGVPKEFFQFGSPDMLPDSVNGSLMQYNTDKTTVPATLDGLLDPKYKGEVSVASYNANVFSGYGMAKGKDAMVKLIGELKSSGTLKILEDQSTPLSSGDVPIALNQTLYNPNPSLKVAPYEDSTAFAQFSGVNVDAKNKAGAMLWELWNAYNPDWIKLRMTDPDFATTQVPYPGLPASTFAQATGLMKLNADALLEAVKHTTDMETTENRDAWIAMINAADKALNG